MKILDVIFGMVLFFIGFMLTYVTSMIFDPLFDLFASGMTKYMLQFGIFMFYFILVVMIPYNIMTSKVSKEVI